MTAEERQREGGVCGRLRSDSDRIVTRAIRLTTQLFTGGGLEWDMRVRGPGEGAYVEKVDQAAGEVAVAGVVPREEPQQRCERLLPSSVVNDLWPSLSGSPLLLRLGRRRWAVTA
jgi:hypothetical protein